MGCTLSRCCRVSCAWPTHGTADLREEKTKKNVVILQTAPVAKTAARKGGACRRTIRDTAG